MTSEFRHIFFSDAELLRIVSDHCRKRTNRLPAGSVLDLRVVEGPEPGVVCQVAPDKGGDQVNITLEGEDLMSAIISYCIGNRIPLPHRGAIKRLQVFGERLALVITINLAGDHVSEI